MSDTPRTDANEWVARVNVDDPALGWGVFDERVVDAKFARELERELAAMREQRDEARRDACAFQGIIKFNLQHPNGIISTEATLRLAKEIASERGWDCFAQKEGGGA